MHFDVGMAEFCFGSISAMNAIVGQSFCRLLFMLSVKSLLSEMLAQTLNSYCRIAFGFPVSRSLSIFNVVVG